MNQPAFDFMAAAIPTQAVTYRLDDGGSYAEMAIVPNGDGTWGIATDGGPVSGRHHDFIAALLEAARELEGHAIEATYYRNRSDEERAFGRKVADWLDGIREPFCTEAWLVGELSKQSSERASAESMHGEFFNGGDNR